MPGGTVPRVLISYSNDSEEHLKRVADLSERDARSRVMQTAAGWLKPACWRRELGLIGPWHRTSQKAPVVRPNHRR